MASERLSGRNKNQDLLLKELASGMKEGRKEIRRDKLYPQDVGTGNQACTLDTRTHDKWVGATTDC